MNRETLVNALTELSEWVGHESDSATLKLSAAMLVMDKIQMEGLVGRINVLNTELTNQRGQYLDQIKTLREEIENLQYEIRELGDQYLG